MKATKILSVIMAVLLAFSFAGCSKVKHTLIYSDFKPLDSNATNGDEYVYSITYEDYDFEKASKTIEEVHNILDYEKAGCTSFRNGNFHARNLDYYINNSAEVLVKVKGSKDRYASMGMLGGLKFISKRSIDSYETALFCDAFMNVVPALVNDGINEKGVVINVNVVPKYECDAPTTGTNPKGKKIFMHEVCRYVLDNAASVDEAVDLLKKANVIAEKEFPFECHYMISDPKKTVVVEFWNNELVVVEKNLMTNYYVSHPDTPYGEGHERAALIESSIPSVKTAKDAYDLLRQVNYSKSYSKSTDPYWYTENLDKVAHPELTYQDILAGNLDKFAQLVEDNENGYVSIDHQKAIRDGKYWYTNHNAVYDMEHLVLTISFQENNTIYKFNMADLLN